MLNEPAGTEHQGDTRPDTQYQQDEGVGQVHQNEANVVSLRDHAACVGFKSARTCAEGTEVGLEKRPRPVAVYSSISVGTEYQEQRLSQRKRNPAECLPTEPFQRCDIRQEHHHRCIGTCHTGTGH